MVLEARDDTSPVAYDRQRWSELRSLRFPADSHNALITAPVGVGKTGFAGGPHRGRRGAGGRGDRRDGAGLTTLGEVIPVAKGRNTTPTVPDLAVPLARPGQQPVHSLACRPRPGRRVLRVVRPGHSLRRPDRPNGYGPLGPPGPLCWVNSSNWRLLAKAPDASKPPSGRRNSACATPPQR